MLEGREVLYGKYALMLINTLISDQRNFRAKYLQNGDMSKTELKSRSISFYLR